MVAVELRTLPMTCLLFITLKTKKKTYHYTSLPYTFYKWMLTISTAIVQFVFYIVQFVYSIILSDCKDELDLNVKIFYHL